MSGFFRSTLAALGALTLVLGYSTGASADQEYKGMTLTVLGANTDLNQLLMKSYGEKFQAQTGATLNFVTGTGPDNLSKALVAKGKEPSFQVLMLEQPTQAPAIKSGVIQKLDYRKIPNVAKIVKGLIPDEGYGAPWDISRLGTCINVVQYKAHNIAIPTSVDGWFDPAIVGHAILPSPANFWWLVGMQALAENYKVPLDNPTPLFKRLEAMKPASFFVASGEAQAKLESGAAWMAPTSDGRCFAMKVAGQPVDFIPLNLQIGGKKYRWAFTNDLWDIPTGVTGKQLELAEKFINMSLEPSAQVPVAATFGFLPTTPEGIKQSMAVSEVKKFGVYEAGFSLNAMYAPEARKLLPHIDKWLAVWNQMFVK